MGKDSQKNSNRDVGRVRLEEMIMALVFVFVFLASSTPSVETNVGLKVITLTSRPEMRSRIVFLTD